MAFTNAIWFCVLTILIVARKCQCEKSESFNVDLVFQKPGDVKLVLLEECNNGTQQDLKATRMNSAIWTVDRLNILQSLGPLNLGLEIYDVCDETQFYDTIYQLFQKQKRSVTVGLISPNLLPARIQEFCDTLNIERRTMQNNHKQIVWVTVELLSILSWKGNVTVVVQENEISEEILKLTRKAWICVTKVVNIKQLEEIDVSQNVAYVIMADGDTLRNTLINSSVLKQTRKVILVSMDGSRLENIPEGFYLIEAYNENVMLDHTKTAKIVPTPMLFDFVHPFISYAKSLIAFLHDHCNNTVDLTTCIRDKFYRKSEYFSLSNQQMVSFLMIEPLQNKFNFDIFFSEEVSFNVSRSLIKLASYNVFQEVFQEYDDNGHFEKFNNNSDDKDCTKAGADCVANCLNFWSSRSPYLAAIRLRSEAWVFAFLAISTLGVIFCIAIIVFMFLRLSKKQILEGNPTLTIILVIVVIFMYLSIIPFSIDGDDETKATIFLIRSFCLALPYAAAFSLILSRVILLATISKEIGFMSHVAGSVQSFMTLFIFGVQCALSIQIIRRCDDVFHSIFILYLISYNILLLVLLLCLSPLITKSQRNYKEGRYFVIATILTAFSWCCWVPGYVVLKESWKDPMLCVGLVTTASIFVGAVFIPKTYLITVSAARDRFSNALPSLAEVSNTLDIYRASAQPVYDCVNITAIKAHTILSGSNTSKQNHQDLYSCPAISDDQASNASTVNPDKLTRF